MNIRPFTHEDSQSVMALWEACELTRPWNNPALDIERKLSVQPELFLVGEVEGTIVATAMAGYDGHRGSVYYLAVSPTHQNRGYGRLMMNHVEETLMALGCPKLNIVVRSTNNNVLTFYDRLGYRLDDIVGLGKRLIPDI